MTPHTNQVVPVEPNYEDFEELITSELFKSFDHSEWKGQIKAFWCVYQEAFEKGAIAAAPQQQGEPVYQVCGIHDGHQSPWSEVTKATYDAYIESDSIKKRILYTHPLTADASFNQGVEVAIGRALYKIRQYLKEKHPAVDSWDMSCAVNEYAGEAKRPTNMVTMTRDKFETHIAAAIGIGLAEAQNRVAGNVGNALDEAKAYVSRALEGK